MSSNAHRDGGMFTGLIILVTILVLSQVGLLMMVISRAADSIPRLEPITVQTTSAVQAPRLRSRTVQLAPVKEPADETTDHVP